MYIADDAGRFLFGESTNCLAPGTGTVSNARFSDAWNHVLETIASDARWGKFGALFPRKQFKENIKFIHGESISSELQYPQSVLDDQIRSDLTGYLQNLSTTT